MTKKNSTIAKISRPRLTSIFRRERLFHLLDKGRNYPVIWITGPPGAGKTTLAASYLDVRKLPCLWYQVDEGDADIASFFYYMGIAIKKAAPGKQRPLPLLTPEYLPNISIFTKRYFEELCRRLKPPFLIVLDNYQDVSTSSRFHDIIIHGLDVIPEGINILVLSRNEPPQQFIRLRANNRISLLEWSEIKFTVDESRKIIQARGKKDISDEAVLQMHEKTDGWVAGLVLLMEIAKTKDVNYQLISKLTPREVFDYFATVTFSKIDEKTRVFLLKTAFLPETTVPMAERLTGVSNAGQILFDLNRKNYFTEVHVHAEPVYQYHPLFREFLLSCAKDTFSCEELSQIQGIAAELLEESGQIEDAAALLRDKKDFERFVQLILNQASTLVVQGRGKTLAEWLFCIPEDIRQKTPWLLYWLGVCQLPFYPEESFKYFDNAFETFRSQGDQTGMWLSWSYLVDTFFHRWDDVSLLDRYISLFESLFQKETTFPSAEVELRIVSYRFVSMMLRQMHHQEIEEWAEWTFSLSQKYQDVNLRLQIHYYLACYYMWVGNFTKAGILVSSFHKDVQSGKATPLAMLVGGFMEVMYEWLTGSTDSCLRIVSDGLKLACETGVHLWDGFFLSHGTCAALSSGDIETATKLLRELESGLVRARKIDKAFFHFLMAWKDVLCGHVPSAKEHMKITLSAAVEIKMSYPIALARALMAQVHFELQAYTEAATELNLAYQIGRHIKSKHVEFTCLLTEAQFTSGYGSTESGKRGNAEERQTSLVVHAGNDASEQRGLDILRRAFGLAREQGYVNTFGWRCDIMPRLCVKALEAEIEVKYVQYLVRKRQIIPEEAPLECENWPWPIRIFTLGRFNILKDDKPIQFTGKVQRKPLELFKAITSCGGREVSEDRIADILWPDADGDMAHQSFETTLHRLRRLIGNDNAIKLQGGQLTLDDRYCWVDTWAFERVFEKVKDVFKRIEDQKAERKGETLTACISGSSNSSLSLLRTEALRLTEKAISIYKGPFLPADIQYLWTMSTRECLRNMFHQLIIMSGNQLEQTGQWLSAVEHYRKAIEKEDLEEEFYQRLMVCYQHLGQKAEAIKVYNRCCAMLLNILGTNPSSKTKDIYNSLI